VGVFIIGVSGNNDGVDACGYATAVIAGILFIVCLAGWPATYIGSVDTIAELEAFQEGVFDTYVATVNATEQAVVKLDLEKLLVSAENIKQSTNLSDRIVELRGKVTWYNENLKKLRAKNQIWWLDSFYKDVPDSLHIIKLTGKELKQETK